MIDIKEKISHIDILSQYDMKMQLRYIKARINRIRLDKNLKQLEFADSIGLSQSGYSTLMGRDGTSQRLKTLALAIEAVYGFRHEWILTGEEPKQHSVSFSQSGEMVIQSVSRRMGRSLRDESVQRK